ncbi:C-type lectin BfL-2-like [Haliotis rubra]|uniref:C-type lectin BfL-2-like n=1 Tax=Haliotis rubra TaxID=36100 RepID=UPI001EE53FAE|nr:C-type lectin BfL-2-like [Haliotis rubra]
MTCRSLFYQTTSKTCYLSDAVYTEGDLQVSADMQYLIWKRDGCDNGYSWNPKLDLCYNIDRHQIKSWMDAEKTCIQTGGHLLKVDNLETNLLMNYLAVKRTVSIWLGGSDIQEEGTWLWADNSSIKSFWWNTEGGEPQGQTNQNCLVLLLNSEDPVNRWHDQRCDKRHRYACQLPVEPSRC